MNPREQLVEHLKFASELGVTGTSREAAWRHREVTRRNDAEAAVTDNASPVQIEPAAASGADTMTSPLIVISRPETLDDIRREIGPACTRCKLHTLGRTQVVFGVGNPNAQLMFVGEAPGADEDAQGIPFVGRAGQLLTKIIEAIELTRDDVYIANVIKCRPPGNRNPEPDEVATCEPYLFRQIDVIKPKVIVTLGKFATQSLLRTEEAISKLRGRMFEYRGAKLIPTWHPSYVLRNNSPNSEVRRQVWEDMKLVKRLLGNDE